ncbi:MAG: ribosome maturation factor RimP [Synergistaceae bacterium]|nr:ribosome maturation factor RimP [Synergistaceae bacterium]
MSDSSKEAMIREIGRTVEELGYECVHAALTTESGRPVVRVFIDSLGGIGIRDCEVVSKALNRYLDEADSPELTGRYYLEVSSPGLERPLFTPADYLRFNGREARIKTLELIDGRKVHTGIIKESDEASVTLVTEEGQRVIPFGLVARATLVFRGLEPQEPKKKPGGKKRKNEAIPANRT